MSEPKRTERSRGEASSPEPGDGLRLGQLFGVGIYVDWSLLIIFALIAFHLGAGVFPGWHPEWGTVMIWVVALTAAVLFFASVLAHELSHALVGRAQGIGISHITLFLFGGMAHMESEPRSPKAELLMALVGPVVSLGIGVLATTAGVAMARPSLEAMQSAPAEALSTVGPLASLLLWLGPINILLGLFNLVPGFPLDGGRVARSVIWWATGDLVKATRWASGLGRIFAWLLMAVGVVSLFGRDVVGGLWLLLIGWFLNNAARMSYQQLLVRRVLEDVPVSRLMFRRMRTIDAGLSVEDLVREHLLTSDQTAYPVVVDDALQGLVTMEDVRRVPQARWPQTTVADIMTPHEELSTLPPEADAEHALHEMSRRNIGQLPVVDQGHVLGMVRRQDLVRWVALQHEPGSPSLAA